jgi:hydrogenase-4 component F
MRLQGLAFGEPSPGAAPTKASYLPMFGHLALVLAAGVFFPPLITGWFQHVARLLG